MDSDNLQSIIQLVFGCIALLAGRNIFWLFIALAGFLLGYEFAATWLAAKPVLVQIAVALGAGLLGALLAVLFERVAFSLAGFYAAAFLAVVMLERSGFASYQSAIILAAGLVGAVLAALVMDWGIIVLSSLFGAAAIVSTLSLSPMIEVVLLVCLAAIGIGVQRAVLMRSPNT